MDHTDKHRSLSDGHENESIWQGWLEIMAGGSSPPPTISQQQTDHRLIQGEVLDWLRKVRPSWVAGKRDISIAKDDYKNIFRELSDKSDIKTHVIQRKFIITMIAVGRKMLDWRVELPPILFQLPREAPVVIEQDMRTLPYYRNLEKKHRDSLKELDVLSKKARAGQILVSAIINGAMFTPWMQRVLIETTQKQWVCVKQGLWASLEKPVATHQKNHDKRKTYRWFSDPVTELLLYRWWEDYRDDTLMMPGVGIKQMMVQFFKEVEMPVLLRPQSVAILTRWASTAWTLEIPPSLRRSAEVTPVWTALPAETWLRVYRNVAVQYFKPKDTDSALPLDRNVIRQEAIDSEDVTVGKQLEYVNKIRRALIGKESTNKRYHAGMTVFKEPHEGATFIACLIGYYGCCLARYGGQKGKEVTASTIGDYLSTIYVPLLNAFKDDDAHKLDAESWICNLQKAIDSSKSCNGGSRIFAFAQFAQKIDGVPYFDTGDLEGVAGGGQVSPNLVTPLEFDRIIRYLEETGSQYAAQTTLITALSFYCGLRKNEVSHLRLIDVSGRSNPVLLVRRHKERRLKYPSSRRLLPLRTLLPEKWYNKLMNWVKYRDAATNKLDRKAYLFSREINANQPLPEKDIFPPIQKAIRKVTGDQTLVFHHLRHSFSNWTLIKLLVPEYPKIIDENIDLFQHPDLSIAACTRFRGGLIPTIPGRSFEPTQSMLYLLSFLMGHHSPDTSIVSYLHLFDLIVHRLVRPVRFRTDDNAWKSVHCENAYYIDEGALKKLIAGSNEHYWYRIREKHRIDGKPGQYNIDSLLSHARKKHTHRLIDLCEKQIVKNEGSGSGRVATRPPIQIRDLPSLLKLIFENKISVGSVADLKNIEREEVMRVSNNALYLYERFRTNRQMPRFPLVPALPRSKKYQFGYQRIMRKLENQFPEREILKNGLRHFVKGVPNRSMEVRLGLLEEALGYLDFLSTVGVPKAWIDVIHFPDNKNTLKEIKEWRLWWAKQLRIQYRQIRDINKGTSMRRVSIDHLDRPCGWVAIGVGGMAGHNYHRNHGVRYALHLLTVWYADQVWIVEH